MGKKLIIKGADFYANALIKARPTPDVPITEMEWITSNSPLDNIPLITSADGYDAQSEAECSKFKLELAFDIINDRPTKNYTGVVRAADGSSTGMYNFSYGGSSGSFGTARYVGSINYTNMPQFVTQGSVRLIAQGDKVTIENSATASKTITLSARSPMPTDPRATLSLFYTTGIPGNPMSQFLRVKYIKIYYDEHLIKDFVPAMQSDIPCLWEKVSNKPIFNIREDGNDLIVG